MRNPLGAAFARKVLRCKARDEGRPLALFDEARNAAAGHFSCKPFGAVLGRGKCFVSSLVNNPAFLSPLPSPNSPPPTPPRSPPSVHQTICGTGTRGTRLTPSVRGTLVH